MVTISHRLVYAVIAVAYVEASLGVDKTLVAIALALLHLLLAMRPKT